MDVRDETMGAWFEANIVRIVPKPSLSEKKHAENKTDGKQEDLEASTSSDVTGVKCGGDVGSTGDEEERSGQCWVDWGRGRGRRELRT